MLSYLAGYSGAGGEEAGGWRTRRSWREGLGKQFGAVLALDGVDLGVPAGGVLGLLGPNGAGKTTLVRILATLVEPDRGRARVAGFDVAADPQAVRRGSACPGSTRRWTRS